MGKIISTTELVPKLEVATVPLLSQETKVAGKHDDLKKVPKEDL